MCKAWLIVGAILGCASASLYDRVEYQDVRDVDELEGTWCEAQPGGLCLFVGQPGIGVVSYALQSNHCKEHGTLIGSGEFWPISGDCFASPERWSYRARIAWTLSGIVLHMQDGRSFTLEFQPEY